MTIRGRVDVYCTDLPGPTFIAVASSTELITSGRPAVVRIVEFMATDPLYKATRIGDFGDFEFRATELHDGIMTLAQVQQLWNQTPADARWWPADPDGSIPFRSGDLIYATLGPWATSELIHALENSSDRSSPTVERVLGGLHQAVGRRPWMLIGLAAAMGAAQRYEAHELRPSDLGMRDSGVDRFVGESLKHLGSLVLEAAQQFGFDWDSFKEWFESQDSGLFENTGWPPTQVPYVLDGPEFDDEFFAGADYQASSSELSASIDPRVRNTTPMISHERLEIFNRLREQAGFTQGIAGNREVAQMLTGNDARSWARLVSATVQAWHENLNDTDNRLSSPYADENFTYNMLDSVCALPSESWNRLTDARRICFVADLGELLMIISQLDEGDISRYAASALGQACNYENDLITIGEQAGLALPYRNRRSEFASWIETIRGFNMWETI
jgi:hypothetical protein